jgi:hypothetical protein
VIEDEASERKNVNFGKSIVQSSSKRVQQESVERLSGPRVVSPLMVYNQTPSEPLRKNPKYKNVQSRYLTKNQSQLD